MLNINYENEKDINKGIYWYEKSAEQGNQYAQNMLKELKRLEI